MGLAGGGCIGGPIAKTANFLAFEFDADNCMVEMRTFAAWSHDAARKKLLEWIDSRKAPAGEEPPNAAPVSGAGPREERR